MVLHCFIVIDDLKDYVDKRERIVEDIDKFVARATFEELAGK